MQQNQCSLVQVARMIGTAVGYVQRSNRGDMIEDARRLLSRSPDRSMIAAAAVGLLLGNLLRSRRLA